MMDTATSGPTLRCLFPGELLADRPLPGHLRDRRGTVLVSRGEVLTEWQLAELHAQHGTALYVGPDWDNPSDEDTAEPAFASPDELILALQRQNRGGQDAARCRRFARHEWRGQLTILVQEVSKGTVYRRQLTVRGRDVSSHGYAMSSPRFLHPGTIVYTRFDALPKQPAFKGVVRNCVYLGEQQHRIGVEFIPFDPGERLPSMDSDNHTPAGALPRTR